MHKQVLVITAVIASIILFVTCSQKKNRGIDSSILVSRYARPLTNYQIASSTKRIERGKYLVNGVLGCFRCHAEVDSAKPGWPALENRLGCGGLLYKQDSIALYAPNITPDKETGAGNWSDDMFIRALRNGIGHDGRALKAMPWWTYRSLSDEDLFSVICYLRSLEPVNNIVPMRHLGAAIEKELQNNPRSLQVIKVAEPDTSTILAKGKYLVTIGECLGCHTAWYERNPGYFGGGNPIANEKTDSIIVSANISSDASGIGTWDDETFIRVIRTGKNGSLHHSMPWINFKNINDDDLKAIFAALKTTLPVEHHIVNGMKPTLCEICGEKHGFGDHNKVSPIRAVAFDTKSYPAYEGAYVDGDMDTVIVKCKDKKLWATIVGAKPVELLPVGNNQFNGSGMPSPIRFISDVSGKITGFVDYGLVPLTFARVTTVKAIGAK
ncbi:hypothetical protein QTN47_26590 [Danxiaibacter flavus]|uniref:Cytochrome c domain-containing protein n=1 Tax=Danxiaibacter flavus TaxID=3049108 RepID=A0ABV3ZMJ7_9BACT|nr:hypothetical protein QNM32_26590 [Chitinophagaceae bacterium DXS]